MPINFRILIQAGFAILSFCFLLTSCRKEDGGVIRINPTHFSANDEAAIGKRLLQESWRNSNLRVIEPESGEFTDAAYDYLRPLLMQLVEQAEVIRRDSFLWDIRLVLDENAHAYTLPGGQIVLHTGLLNSLSNEAECIGILAREIALADQGAAMAALQRQVDDNVTLGDMILGNPVPLDQVIQEIPRLTYTQREVYRADSLASRLVCQSDYEERGLTIAVSSLPDSVAYKLARPTQRRWDAEFNSRVSECPGADSLYRIRYREMLSRYIPR